MKELVRKIFGDEAAEKPDIVEFYESVQKTAMEEHAIDYAAHYTGHDRGLVQSCYLRFLLVEKEENV